MRSTTIIAGLAPDAPVAYLPQHVWEVGASVFGALLILISAIVLIRGKLLGAEHIKTAAIRLIAALQIVVGAGIIAAAFTVHAEPPCRGCRPDHWGGVAGVIGLAIWLIFGLVVMVPTMRRALGSRGPTPTDKTRHPGG